LINILFKNEDFIVVDKPCGMNFHSEDGQPGVIALLAKQLELDTLYPVHRLDKMTSGLLIVALTKSAAQTFQSLFETRNIEKYYLAISDKKPKKKQGWVKGDMQPARNGSWKLSKTMENPTLTQFISVSTEPGERLFLLKPHTGKTHQLRVLMKSLAAPICGDLRYANKLEAAREDRGYLHAYALSFEFNDEAYRFVQPPNAGMRFLKQSCQAKIALWQNPWDFFKGSNQS